MTTQTSPPDGALADNVATASPATRGRASRRPASWLAKASRELWPAALTGVVFVVAWEIAARTGLISTFFFSSPMEIAESGRVALADVAFWSDVRISFEEFLIGYVLGVVVAVPFGLLTASYRPLEYMFDPWLSALNALPRIALLPLVVLWFGLDMPSKIVIVFLGVFVSVTMNTFYGVRTVDRGLMDVARSYGASPLRRVTTIVAPTVSPFILVGMRLGVGRAVTGVIVAEFFTSDAGLGNYILRAGQTLRTGDLLFGTVFVTVCSLGLFGLLAAFEKRVTRWRPAVGSAQ